ELATRYRRPALELSPRTEEWIASCPWPGNVRELRFALERAVLLADPSATELELQDFSNGVAATQAPVAVQIGVVGPDVAVELPAAGIGFSKIERAVLAAALRKAGGNVVAAARLVHLRRDAMRYRLRKHRIIQDKASEDAGASDTSIAKARG